MILEGGPDARRYIALAQGVKVSRPFQLRWLLPVACRTSPVRWWVVWVTSWPILFAGMVWWVDDWSLGIGAAVLVCALPGILGPKAVIPVGVDLPATALTVVSAALYTHGWTVAALIVLCASSAIRETCPVWVALWLWTPLPLVVLVVPLIRFATSRPGPDPLGPKFQHIADHPVRSALEAHKGRWRDAWLMVAPWGATLAALHHPTTPVLVLLAVAHLQLLVATDTVRLVHHAAGPALAVVAARNIPPSWLVLACVAHVFWWWTPERI